MTSFRNKLITRNSHTINCKEYGFPLGNMETLFMFVEQFSGEKEYKGWYEWSERISQFLFVEEI